MPAGDDAKVVTQARAPSAEPRRHIRVRELCVIALAFAFHAAFFAWFPSLRSPNELTRVYLAKALVERHSLEIGAELRRYGPIADVAMRTIDGKAHYYSDKAPGVSLLSAPVLQAYAYARPEPRLAEQVRVVRLWVATLPTLLLLALLLSFLRESLVDQALPAWIVLAYALGSVATPYAALAFGHQLSAALLFALFMLCRGSGPSSSGWRSIGVGATAALALMVEYQNAPFLVLFGVFYLVRVRLAPRPVALALAGAAPLVAVLLAYHQAAFGSVLKSGYDFLLPPFRELHARGIAGVVRPDATQAFLSFVSPARGLWFFSPWLALAVPGLVELWRSSRLDRRFILVFLVLYALFVCSLLSAVGGWMVSQRYLVPAVPFMLLPAALCIERLGRAGRVLFVGLALPGMLACGISSVVWPHWQEHLQNPFWQLGWPLFRDGWVVPSALALLGVSTWWLAVGLLAAGALFLLVELGFRQSRAVWRVGAPLAALALALGYVALARLPGRDQNVAPDRRFIERHYAADPHSPLADR